MLLMIKVLFIVLNIFLGGVIYIVSYIPYFEGIIKFNMQILML